MRVRLFESDFPICHLYGMTEEQFWRSNPRIIKVWEKAYKERMNMENRMNHILGFYVHQGVSVAVGKALNGRKYKGKYLEEPIRIFAPTEEEKKREQKEALARAVAFFNAMEKDSESKDTPE